MLFGYVNILLQYFYVIFLSDNLISNNVPFKSRTRISLMFMVCTWSSLSSTSWGCSGSSSKSFKHVICFFTVAQSAGPSSSSSLSSPKASNALFSISYLVYFNTRSCQINILEYFLSLHICAMDRYCSEKIWIDIVEKREQYVSLGIQRTRNLE
jgi:hypothetical protein